MVNHCCIRTYFTQQAAHSNMSRENDKVNYWLAILIAPLVTSLRDQFIYNPKEIVKSTLTEAI